MMLQAKKNNVIGPTATPLSGKAPPNAVKNSEPKVAIATTAA
jgi:hypothetical protein